MAIIRGESYHRFTTVSNQMLEDTRLSFKAKGILTYLLSKPDGWRTSYRFLQTIGPDGETAVRSALNELEEAGYLIRDTGRNEDGTYYHDSIIYDEPRRGNPSLETPSLEKPSLEKPSLEKPRKVNTDKANTDIANTDVVNTDVVGGDDGKTRGLRQAHSKATLAYEREIGVITYGIATKLMVALSEYPEEWIVDAIDIAASNNARTWAYVNAILLRWKAQGKSSPIAPRSYGNKASPTSRVAKSMAAVDRVFDKLEEELDGEPE